MLFRRPCSRRKSANSRVRMNVCAAIDPSSPPASVIDKQGVPAPVKAAIKTRGPAPRPEESAERHPKTEADGAAHNETGPWREEDDSRVICRHDEERGINRHNCDVRS